MNAFSKFFQSLDRWTVLFIIAVVAVVGCRSMDKPASASFASVVISNASPAQIREATEKVFKQSNYQSLGEQEGSLVFQREATERETVDYAGFAGAHDGDKVVIQVRVRIEVKDPSAYWLTCKAYAISNPDQPVFRTTTALFNFQSKPYQKLLNMVAGTVRQITTTP